MDRVLEKTLFHQIRYVGGIFVGRDIICGRWLSAYIRSALRRRAGSLITYAGDLPSCVVAIEACCRAHRWDGRWHDKAISFG